MESWDIDRYDQSTGKAAKVILEKSDVLARSRFVLFLDRRDTDVEWLTYLGLGYTGYEEAGDGSGVPVAALISAAVGI